MNRKVKGFTLLETIITLTIMVVVLAVVSSVFINSRKLMVKTELKSQMQEEGEKLQKSIVTYGTQAIDLSIKENSTNEISGWTIRDYKDATNSNGGYLDIASISFLLPNGVNGDTNLTVADNEYLLCNMMFESTGSSGRVFIKRIDKLEGDLSSPTITKDVLVKTVSKDIESVSIIPLNWQELKEKADDSKTADLNLFDEMTGIKVTAKFKKKQGNIEVEYEVSSIVKFRNN
ncbi:prepilin-type N-terminal cleavage/methylation domain-containing protein [Clostridium sp. MSJ-8]|uniref:pilus assembly FimT family protein n=1 Tax=Clostridium sp. MSJ-8 TaxID=2841510 RepID=UPI001C0F0C7E|nr:prepilin-type N-terminal cleavage/methylation domain-containing protein [Clostridium sp. MSJ-8]MBU5488058.1 prepilin-type N-terminal cleavage/methylation domain-containing protein [Clostridium sp. MSJ-8]